MQQKTLRFLCLLLALVTAFSAMGTSFSAARQEESGTYEEAGPVAVGTNQPEFTAMEACAAGVLMRWKQVENIYFYRIYRWYDDGRGWVKLHDTDLLEYIDTGVATGNTYQYRLVGISADGNILTTSVNRSIEYYAAIKVTNTESVANGIRLSWNKVPGMSKAAVYRKKNGSWSRITTSADSSYTDTDVSVGGEYTYTVRSLDENGAFQVDYYDKTGVTHRYLSIPAVKVQNAVDGVKVSWSKVTGAESYRVFRKDNGSWKRVGDTETTSLTDKTAVSGKTCTYTVRCIAADEVHYTSYFDKTGKSILYVAAPVLVSAQGTVEGIKVTWKKSDGAAKYRVFRKDNGSWKRIGDATGTTLTDKNVTVGVSTAYTVRCMNEAGDYISAFYPGVSGIFLSAPDFTVSNAADGVKISWKAVTGAVNYRVYCYGAKGWVKLADTAQTSYIDTNVTSGNAYSYTVRCINAEGTAFTSGYREGKNTKFVAAPKITSLVNSADGVKITWGAVGGAQKYRVYYYAENGWKRLADTAETSYLDKTAVSGTAYRYTVRCVNNAGTAFMSSYRAGESITYIDTPDFKLTLNQKSITISWDKVQGASMYRVFIKNDNKWKKLADISGTSYEDKNVVSGGTYTYTVCCLDENTDEAVSAQLEGKSARIVFMPAVSSVSNGEEGVNIKWSAVAGAVKYRVYYKNGTGWTKVGDTAETEYVHAEAESGKSYTYTVRCINAAGTAFESAFDKTGKTILYIAAPKNLKAAGDGSGIKISWTHSNGAEKYRVYLKNSSGSWTRLADTTENTYVDTKVDSGKTYCYTVRCLSADGKRFTSNFNHEGVSCKFTLTPVLNAADYAKDGIVVSWKEVKGSEKYRVYTYDTNGWKKVAETTATTLIDKDVSSGKTYRYTVRCVSADGKSFTSDYDHTGVSIYYVAAPKLLNMESDTKKIVFSWSKPRGAEKYRVYRKNGGSWKKLTDTTANSYTDKDIAVGNTYTYTIRVISTAGDKFYSGYDPAGFSVTVTADVSDFRYYDQGQYNYPYGDDTIAYSGCGPTCFAMIASTLTGKSITPIDAVAWCGNSYYLMGVGTYWSYFKDAADYFGITMEKQLGADSFDTAVAALKKGKYVISAQSSGLFTRGGHFIVLAGITSEGKIIVYDPNGGNHYVGTAFDPDDISVSGTQYWVFSK